MRPLEDQILERGQRRDVSPGRRGVRDDLVRSAGPNPTPPRSTRPPHAQRAPRNDGWPGDARGSARAGRAPVALGALPGPLPVELPSGRERARHTATALALDPGLMLLDEPTQGMGHEDVGRVVELIRKVAAKRTVLMVEHNMNVVANLSDSITVLARGSVLAEGAYEQVSKDPLVLEAYVGTAEEQVA